ncbi:MAG TPA: dihydrolipoyl dehydrogenase [Acidimicrobiales bacterium]|nr:dihydrolipoyl dehydrogenase [Acidimicrobiales bacterium]
MNEQFDVLVIGGGPGGYAAALYASAADLSVALVERDRVGGTCLHRGCIPAKELLETASVFRTVAGAGQFGVGVQGGDGSGATIDLATSMKRKQQVVDGLWKGLEGLLGRRKVSLYAGTGTLSGPGCVSVLNDAGEAEELRGDAVILASGSLPRTIPGFEVDGRLVLTSDEVLAMDDLPGSAAVIGGGAIGCEFASMLADLGVQVTLLESLPKILPGCDEAVAAVVRRSFTKRGIDVRTGVKVTGHAPGGGGTAIAIEGSEALEVERVVVSVGRRPLSDNLGLDDTGVEVDERGFVKIDQSCRTTLEGVWAVGDLVATPQLAHVGFAEGITAVRDILGEQPLPVQYDKVPWCIYCHPEVAFVGHSEESARQAGYDVVASTHHFRGNGRALIVGEADGLVKVVAERRPDGTAGTVLGVHMVGPWVTEQLGQGYLAVNWEATVEEVAALIQPHPTLSETFGEAAMALTGRGLHG